MNDSSDEASGRVTNNSDNPFKEYNLFIEDENDDASSDNEESYLIKPKSKKKIPSYLIDNGLNLSSDNNANGTTYDEFDVLVTPDKPKSNSCFNFKCSFIKPKYIKKFSNNKIVKFIQKNSSHLSTVKSAILIIYTIFCIAIFSLNDSKETEWTQTVISNKTENKFSCYVNSEHSTKTSTNFVRFKLNGPFIQEADVSKNDINSGKYVNIYLYSNKNSNFSEPTQLSFWKVILKMPDDAEMSKYSENTIVTKIFDLNNSFDLNQIDFLATTNIKDYLSFNFNCVQMSNHYRYSVLYSAILLIFVYVLIIFELTHRTLAAGLGSIGGISLLTLVEMERPSLKTIVTWVEWETILLLFGMMVIVAIFCETGFFDLIAVRIFHYSGTRIWLMIGSLCLLSALLSAFLDNVTTILLLTPITIRLCEVMKLDPRIIIIAEVIFANIGGTSTAIGDPPNVIISANKIISSKGIDFSRFTFHMLAGSVFVYIVCFFQFRLLYSNVENFSSQADNEFDEMKKEITIWTRSFQSITPITKEEKIVKTLLKEKVSQLENLLSQKRYLINQELKKSLEIKSQEMIENYKITNKPLFVKCSIIFTATLLLFFLNPFIDSIHLTIGWISILSSLLLLASSSSESISKNHTNSEHSAIDFEGLMHKIEWSTLLFFSGLFIFMKSVEELGLLNYLGNLISNSINSIENKSDKLVFALVMLIILSAIISSIIDNIPFTTAMIPIIIQLSDKADLPLPFLTYALAFGSCLGGNGTLIGASCNLVAAGICEQHGYKITFGKFFKVSFPIMLSSIMVTIIYICIISFYIEWF